MDVQEQELNAQDIWELFRETNRMFQETDRKLIKLSENLENTRKEVGRVTDSLGRFAESMVSPAVVRLFAKRDIVLEGTTQRARRRRNGRGMEFDVLAVNRVSVVAVEVKTTLRADDVAEFVKKLEDFKTFFPEYRDYEVLGAVAGMSLQEGVDKYAERQGLYVLAQSGDAVQMLNDEDFEARVW
ncbi:MAG: DUF3782 domain-containing protein [Anaerolineae bacterium]|nr:DUF3782 domain-containing protein [Anaerolineae bacterium]